jgi:NAD dependent epimerase/dehydratase
VPLTGRRVLVTGAAGFIGSHLVQQLLQEGTNVRALIRYQSMNRKGWLDTLPPEEKREIEVIAGDLRDYQAVKDAVKGMDIVFHLGALIAIPYSYRHPVDVTHTNVLGTLHVALAVREHSIPLMIHTSTSETYGTARYVPMDETHPLQGQSPYAASKIGADKIVESFYRSYDLPILTLRPFNSFGPRQSTRAVIPTIIQQALHGNRIRLGNLEATRDFTYVKDTARAFICAARTGWIGKGWGETFNVGSGREIAIGELVNRIQRLSGQSLPVEVEAKRTRPKKSEVDRLCSDSSKAHQILGWKPLIPLNQGLLETMEWVRRFPQEHPEEYTL